jgi:hypothetical protein
MSNNMRLIQFLFNPVVGWCLFAGVGIFFVWYVLAIREELNGLKEWIKYPDVSYKKNGNKAYHNLAEMIEIISRKGN